jgi:hypothetical protein
MLKNRFDEFLNCESNFEKECRRLFKKINQETLHLRDGRKAFLQATHFVIIERALKMLSLERACYLMQT